MKNTRIAVAALLALTLIASGCADDGISDKKTDKLSGNIDVDKNLKIGQSYLAEMKATESNQQALVKSEPIPNMEKSLERSNLIKRYKTLNDQNEVFHVYLMSHGKVVSYFTAQGKVSSVNSKLTNPEQFVSCDRTQNMGRDEDCVVSAPQLDGSYGTNGDGVFFFTTDGSYVEWNGEYMVSQRPLNIQTPLSLEADVNVSQ